MSKGREYYCGGMTDSAQNCGATRIGLATGDSDETRLRAARAIICMAKNFAYE